MATTWAIIGAGDLGKQIAHYVLTDRHADRVVFFDDYTTAKEVATCKVLGNTDLVEHYFNKNTFSKLLIGIGYKHLAARASFFERFCDTIPFATLVHSTAWVDPTARIGPGTVIFPRSLLDKEVSIASNVLLNVGCTIAHDTTIGSHSFCSPRVAFAGFCKVESQCVFGINCTVIDNIRIGASIRVGAGAVIVKNLLEAGTYVGVPAKRIK